MNFRNVLKEIITPEKWRYVYHDIAIQDSAIRAILPVSDNVDETGRTIVGSVVRYDITDAVGVTKRREKAVLGDAESLITEFRERNGRNPPDHPESPEVDTPRTDTDMTQAGGESTEKMEEVNHGLRKNSKRK